MPCTLIRGDSRPALKGSQSFLSVTLSPQVLARIDLGFGCVTILQKFVTVVRAGLEPAMVVGGFSDGRCGFQTASPHTNSNSASTTTGCTPILPPPD